LVTIANALCKRRWLLECQTLVLVWSFCHGPLFAQRVMLSFCKIEALQLLIFLEDLSPSNRCRSLSSLSVQTKG
jgi:hypothetical protein